MGWSFTDVLKGILLGVLLNRTLNGYLDTCSSVYCMMCSCWRDALTLNRSVILFRSCGITLYSSEDNNGTPKITMVHSTWNLSKIFWFGQKRYLSTYQSLPSLCAMESLSIIRLSFRGLIIFSGMLQGKVRKQIQ